MESNLGDLCATAVIHHSWTGGHFVMSFTVLFCVYSWSVFVLADGSSQADPLRSLLAIPIAPHGLRRHPDDGKAITWRRLG